MLRPTLALALFALLAGTTARAAITHEDLWLMPRVAPAVASPDGRWAVTSVTQPAYEADAQSSDLWLVATDGSSPPRQLTATRGPESGYAWSPDSRRIAFAAKRDGDSVAQIYVLDLRGGEARRVTTLPTGARSPRFSPDGTRLLFTSDAPPDTTSVDDLQARLDARAARKHSARTYTGFPIRNWDHWLEDTQPRLFVQPLDGGPARDLLAGSALLREPGYGGRVTLTDDELDATWTPDGGAVVFIASRNRHRAALAFTHTDLFVVPADGGEPRRLTGPDGHADSDVYTAPRFTPDGRRLVASVAPRTARVYNAARLDVFGWPDARRERRIEAPDARGVAGFAPASDSRGVWFTAEDAGQEKLYRADLATGAVRPVMAPTAGLYTGLSVAERSRTPVLVASHESATEPLEVVRLDPKTGRHALLTRFTRERAAALALPPLEHFTSTTADGRPVHNMLVRPAGFDPSRRYPMLVLIHGGPHIMWRDSFFLRWNYHLLAQPGVVVLLTNYRGSTGFGEAFAQSIEGDPLKGPADDLLRAAQAAVERFTFIDGERQCAGGASYGGHLANWLQGTTTHYRCLVSHAGLVNLESQWGTSDLAYSREANNGGPVWEQGPVWREQNPIRLAGHYRTPVLVTFGERDFRVPINNGLEYWAALQRQQVESRLVVYPDENHWIQRGENSRHFYGEVRDWLVRWLDLAPPAATAQ